jgi:hypothetical protein
MTLRCPECRTRRTTFSSMIKHIDVSGHSLCKCGGYHYAHRPRSPCCTVNPWSTYNQAVRAGASDEELDGIGMDIVWDVPGSLKDWGECPF